MFALSKKVLLLFASRGQNLKFSVVNRVLEIECLKILTCSVPCRTKKHLTSLFTPVPVKPSPDYSGSAVEIAGELDKQKLIKAINVFNRRPELKKLAYENGIDEIFLHKGLLSFRNYILKSENLSIELHIYLADIINGCRNHLDIFPFFLRYIKDMYPHLEYMEDLKKIGDISDPASWYQGARKMKRKIIFHCGPTNSGKTYSAIKSFIKSKSGVYCGPLKLLAVEIFNKANEQGTPCDLVTGEEIIYVKKNGEEADHISCTVEMCSTEKPYDVAVIDEIQMIKDTQRGWAWTRALLGLKAKEIHLCGEEAAVDIVDTILCTVNEDVEVKKYNRLTKLTTVDPIETFDNIMPGDCVVCFNKADIFHVTQTLEQKGINVAVIYGSLPPGTKLSQCKKFNDPNDPCNVLVATDAVGMGLNLSIRRIIFYSLMKPTMNEVGEYELVPISVSQCLQIAGRAGRFGTKYSEGFVTTFKKKDLNMLAYLFSKNPEPVLSAGILPTVDQIEMYSYFLPNSSLSNLIEIFINLSTVDESTYFICDLQVFRFLAEMLEHVSLPLRVKYTFCCAPINKKIQFVCIMLVKFAKLYSENTPITCKWVRSNLPWPFQAPKTLRELVKLEAVHDVLDLYLWLSYRYPDFFTDGEEIKAMQQQLDKTINEGVIELWKLLKAVDKNILEASLKNNNTFQALKNFKKAKYPSDESINETDETDQTDERKIESSCEIKKNENLINS